MKCPWLRGRNAYGNDNMYMSNMECRHVTWCTHVVCEVRVGGRKKNFEPYVLPKWQHVKLVMSISQSAWTTFMNEAQLRSIVTPHKFVLPEKSVTKFQGRANTKQSSPLIFCSSQKQGAQRACFFHHISFRRVCAVMCATLSFRCTKRHPR